MSVHFWTGHDYHWKRNGWCICCRTCLDSRLLNDLLNWQETQLFQKVGWRTWLDFTNLRCLSIMNFPGLLRQIATQQIEELVVHIIVAHICCRTCLDWRLLNDLLNLKETWLFQKVGWRTWLTFTDLGWLSIMNFPGLLLQVATQQI